VLLYIYIYIHNFDNQVLVDNKDNSKIQAPRLKFDEAVPMINGVEWIIDKFGWTIDGIVRTNAESFHQVLSLEQSHLQQLSLTQARDR